MRTVSAPLACVVIVMRTIAEGKELVFYLRKIKAKKGK